MRLHRTSDARQRAGGSAVAAAVAPACPACVPPHASSGRPAHAANHPARVACGGRAGFGPAPPLSARCTQRGATPGALGTVVAEPVGGMVGVGVGCEGIVGLAVVPRAGATPGAGVTGAAEPVGGMLGTSAGAEGSVGLAVVPGAGATPGAGVTGADEPVGGTDVAWDQAAGARPMPKASTAEPRIRVIMCVTPGYGV